LKEKRQSRGNCTLLSSVFFMGDREIKD
jgi:hypothetical protein